MSTRYIDRRRRFERFSVTVQVDYWWRSAEGEEQHASGYTRDISAHGMFIVSQRCPAESNVIEVELTLPSESPTPRRMKLRGWVLRTELLVAQHKAGFAIHNEKQIVRVTPTRAA